jgi:hypothetical protein
MPDIQVTTEGVRKLMKNLNPSKASSPDNIPARLLKDYGDIIAPILQIIFQRSLDSGQIPKAWRSAYVAAVFKKGERYLPENYRPVSLTCISSKLLEHIIVSSMMKHLDSYNALVDE